MGKRQYWEAVFKKTLQETDPDVAGLIRLEEERQARKIVMIPSESICPRPVLEALGSAFNNVYAEGYIPSMMVGEKECLLQQQEFQLARFRRYSDRRFYRGCDYTNLVEALAQRRAARLFSTRKCPAERLWVNVQPLSGAAANNAVYDAFVKPGDVVMGMNLMHGGHLTHGSEFNRSGKNYRIVSYGVSPATGKLEYDEILELAKEHRPKMIIAGYTSYPWAPDWKEFRKAADEVGAILLADISHTAGLVVAGVYPNPVDYADVVTCTTHKTLFGPRGAIMITRNPEHAQTLEQAVFPGEQGGPHVNKFAAMAVAFGIAAGEEYKRTQRMIVKNAGLLAGALQNEGLSLAYGGTDTHLLLVDCNKTATKSGYPLKGEIAVRILDLCGIVANKNTIPGDTVTAEASGVRLGTPWITQRGITPEGIEELGSIIAHILKNIMPFSYIGLSGDLPRGKIAIDVLRKAQERVDRLASTLAAERFSGNSGYPYIGYESDTPSPATEGGLCTLFLHGERVVSFLEQVVTGAVRQLGRGEGRRTFVLNAQGGLLACVYVQRVSLNEFLLVCRKEEKKEILVWLRGLSDGYVMFDEDDIFKKVEGPVLIEDMNGTKQHLLKIDLSTITLEGCERGTDARALHLLRPQGFDLKKPYFVGQRSVPDPLDPEETDRFSFTETKDGPPCRPQRAPRTSCLYEEHIKLTNSFVDFVGWQMPVRYEGIMEEHRAVRTSAGIFDISHMGIIEVTGEHATHFLDCIASNYVPWIKDHESQYSYLLDPDGNVIDDIMVYRQSGERYIVVVNAVNTEKDLAWMRAVNDGKALLDRLFPKKRTGGKVVIRDLKDASCGKDRLVNIALQGPLSLALLIKVCRSKMTGTALSWIKKTCFDTMAVGGIPMIVSRTGYTGEETGFELFVHPDRAQQLWRMLVNAGATPVGLGARDSLRIEAGLPLYGHELAGPRNISPPEAGFGPYIKFHKPFFVGRDPLLKKTGAFEMMIARFRMNRTGVRIAKQGDIVVGKRGQKVIGEVTSCALGKDGVQVGMAIVDRRFAREGTPLGIIPGTGSGARLLSETAIGDRVALHEEATVITRFPEQ
jgi:glycine hydroxymethyltransferase